MPKISSVVTAAFLAYAATTAEGFTPSSLMHSSSASTQSLSSGTTALHVSVVSSFLTREEADSKVANVFETETPHSVGVEQVTGATGSSSSKTMTVSPHQQDPNNATQSRRRRRRNRRKHNFGANEEFRHEQPDTDFYTLHSSAVSHLQKDMPINDIMRAIKRAQNLHDVHDLGTIAAFLIDECDEDWGYGVRGSLLSRTAVAALHMGELEIATRAIQTRRIKERASMQPYEGAAIVRGLMRVQQVDQAWDVLEDELRLPLQGTDWNSAENQDVLKHRARVLASIVSRHFHSGEPHLASRALESLGAMGNLLEESHMESGNLHLPWSRLVNAALDCQVNPEEECSVDLPSDLSELVFDVIAAFPCPGGEEECGLDEYLEFEE